jgi:hypothetical protein
MSTVLYIVDDGDETVDFVVNEEVIHSVNHDEHGWAGMEDAIKFAKELADTFGFEVIERQDVV